jgi:hypothetical protein
MVSVADRQKDKVALCLQAVNMEGQLQVTPKSQAVTRLPGSGLQLRTYFGWSASKEGCEYATSKIISTTKTA